MHRFRLPTGGIKRDFGFERTFNEKGIFWSWMAEPHFAERERKNEVKLKVVKSGPNGRIMAK